MSADNSFSQLRLEHLFMTSRRGIELLSDVSFKIDGSSKIRERAFATANPNPTDRSRSTSLRSFPIATQLETLNP